MHSLPQSIRVHSLTRPGGRVPRGGATSALLSNVWRLTLRLMSVLYPRYTLKNMSKIFLNIPDIPEISLKSHKYSSSMYTKKSEWSNLSQCRTRALRHKVFLIKRFHPILRKFLGKKIVIFPPVQRALALSAWRWFTPAVAYSSPCPSVRPYVRLDGRND